MDWRDRLRTGSVKNVLVLMGGSAFSQAILLATAPVLTRLYPEADIGAYLAFTAVFGLGATWASLRFELAIPLVGEDDVRRAVWLSLATTAVISGLLMVILLFVGAERAGRFIGLADGQHLLIMWAPLAVAAESWRLSARVAAVRDGAFRRISVNFAVAAVGRSALQIGLAFATGSAAALVISDLVIRLVSALDLASRAIRVSKNSSTRLVNLARRYVRFPLLSAPATMFNALTLQAPLLLLTAKYGLGFAAAFGLVQRLTTVPVALLGRSIMEVFYNRAAETQRSDPVGLADLYWRTAKGGLFAGLGLVAPGLFVAALVAPFVFGADYAEMRPLLLIMIPHAVGQLVSVVVDPALAIVERQDVHLVREILRGIVTLGALGVSMLFDSGLLSVAVLSFVGTIAYVGYVLSAGWAVRETSELAG